MPPVFLLVLRAWQRRWISDDAMISFRVLENLHAGNGPVLNAGERIEVGTSVLWPYLIYLGDLLAPVAAEWVAIVASISLMAMGLVIAHIWGGRLLRLAADPDRAKPFGFLPLGAIVVAPIAAMWDFSTSGMELGLVSAWLGGSYAALVRARQGASGDERSPTWPWVMLGLGPLVRPDLGLMAVVFLGAAALLTWRSRGVPLVRGVMAALALPVLYQVFRMGYYAVLVPHPAISKSATEPRWELGWAYLAEFVGTYRLWVVAAAVVIGLSALLMREPLRDRADAIVLMAPVLAGVLHGLYIVRVGGDFMHGRLLLPTLLAVCLPVAAVPFRRVTAASGAVVVVWAAVALFALRPDYVWHEDGFIANERAFYVTTSGHPNPVTMADYANHPWLERALEARRALEAAEPEVRVGRLRVTPDPPPARQHVLTTEALGLVSRAAGIEVHIVDVLALGDPVAARTERVRQRPGHGKELPLEWVLARFGPIDLGDIPPETEEVGTVADARRALACPSIVELLEAVEAPLTPERFLRNLVRAPRLTKLQIPRDPAEAARCEQ